MYHDKCNCQCNWSSYKMLTFVTIITYVTAVASPGITSTSSIGPQRFAIEPSDKTAIINDTILLSCRVVNKVGTLQWTRDTFGLGVDPDLKMYPRYTMLGNDEEGDYSLQIKSVSLEDDAKFQCQVGASEGSRGIVSRVATVTVYVPPEPPIINENEIIHTTAGTRKEISCEAGNGKPAAELTWLDSDGNPVPRDQVHHSTKSNSDGKRATSIAKWSVITTRHMDGKSFTCRSENPALKKPARAVVKFSVKYSPEVTINTDHKYIIEGQNVTFTCDTHANPREVKYKWFLDGKLVSNNEQSDSKWILFNARRDLHHGLKVECEATNSIGSNRKEYIISIQYGPVLLTPLKEIMAVSLGESVTLTCDIIGNPQPRITWILETSGEAERVLSHQAQLKLTSVTQDDAGTYVCLGSVEKFAPIRASTKLFINGPPRVTGAPVQYVHPTGSLPSNIINGVSSPSASTAANSVSSSSSPSSSNNVNPPIRIECLIESVPPPSRVSWYKSGTLASKIEVSSIAASPSTSGSWSDTSSTIEPSSIASLNPGSTATATAAVTSNGDSMYRQILEPIDASSPELLRNILLISPARDGDFDAIYNCTAENEYGTSYVVISLAKQRTIPLFTITIGIGISAITLLIIGILCLKRDIKSEKESNLHHCHDAMDSSSTGGHSVAGSTDLHHHSSTRNIIHASSKLNGGNSGVSSVSTSKNASPATGVKNMMNNLTHSNYTPNSDMHDSRSNGTDSDLKVEILTSSSISGGDIGNATLLDANTTNEMLNNNLNNNLHHALQQQQQQQQQSINSSHLHHHHHLYASGHHSLPHVHTAIHSYGYPSNAMVTGGNNAAYHTLYSHHGHHHSHQHHPVTATLLQQVPSTNQYWDSLMYPGSPQSTTQSIVNGLVNTTANTNLVLPGSISGSSNHSSSGHSPQPNVPTSAVVASGHLVIPVSSNNVNGSVSNTSIGYTTGPNVVNSSSSMWSAGSSKAPLYQSYV